MRLVVSLSFVIAVATVLACGRDRAGAPQPQYPAMPNAQPSALESLPPPDSPSVPPIATEVDADASTPAGDDEEPPRVQINPDGTWQGKVYGVPEKLPGPRGVDEDAGAARD